jgi:hypothetical protein
MRPPLPAPPVPGATDAARMDNAVKSPITPDRESSSAEEASPKDSEPTAPSSKSTSDYFQTVATRSRKSSAAGR